MYVCLCQGITEREIRNEVRAGACCMRDLQKRLGVAQCCGRCGPCARDVLADSLREAEREAAPATMPLVPVPANAT